MTMARAIMVGLSVLATFGGVFLLARLRRPATSEPGRVALRIWGVIALAFGAMLATFAVAMPRVGAF